ncbi:MAG TPA: hypothetical protein VHC63_13340 [Acidimicrobiales bacterium]|nr:hypothetical protein [Acidimicrobiales bacterium]
MPAVKAALVALLSANGALAGVQISQGYPGESFIEREAIYTDRVTGRHEIANIKAGRKQRDENYALTLVVSVVSDAPEDVADVETRAFVLLQEIEDTLADDPSLGNVDGVVHAVAGQFRELADPTTNGAACVIEFEVEVNARLI